MEMCQSWHYSKECKRTFAFQSKKTKNEKVLDSFLHWTEIDNIKCNTDKELLLREVAVEPYHQYGVSNNFSLLQDDCKYSAHVKTKLCEATYACLL